MSNGLRLTIGIPTYNGSKYIREAISSIIAQLNDFEPGQVEILVSDNASTDDTATIVEEYVNNYKHIVSYVCNPTNLGYDKNVDNIFKHAKGDFVWLLGDDDYLMQGSLTKLFRVIDQNADLSVILMSVLFLDIVTSETSQMITYDTDFPCNNGDVFFQKCKWGLAAVSSLVIRKDDWNSKELAKYFGSQWIHIGAVVNILRNNSNSYIIAESMVVVRVSNSRWESQNGNQLMLSFACLDILHDMIKIGYREETYQFYLKDRFRRNLFDIIYLRPSSFIDRCKLANRMIPYYKLFATFWFIHLPILFMPNSVLSMLRALRRVLLKIIDINKYVAIWRSFK